MGTMVLCLPFIVSVLLVPNTVGERLFSIRMWYAGHKILVPFNGQLQGESFQLSKVVLDSCGQGEIPPGLLPSVAVR